MKLTKKQQQVLEFLKEKIVESGHPPSTREIQEHFGFSSQTAAVGHLKALEKKGILTRQPGKARALSLQSDVWEEEDFQQGFGTSVPPSALVGEIPLLHVPLLGSIPAGQGVEMEELKEGTLTFDPQLFKFSASRHSQNEVFALRVRGESMIDAHILDGDQVILEKRTPKSGDVVAALIDGESTLKRYLLKNGSPYLKAENPDYPDLIPARELLIQGVMVGLIRHAWRSSGFS